MPYRYDKYSDSGMQNTRVLLITKKKRRVKTQAVYLLIRRTKVSLFVKGKIQNTAGFTKDSVSGW